MLNSDKVLAITSLDAIYESSLLELYCYTVKPVLKVIPIGHKTMVSQDRSLVICSIALKWGTFCLPRMYGPSRQVVCHSSGLSRQVSLYIPYTSILGIYESFI